MRPGGSEAAGGGGDDDGRTAGSECLECGTHRAAAV